MKHYLTILIVLLTAAMAYGQITVVTPPLSDGVYVLRISNGQASLSVGVQPNVGPIVTPVIVDPVIPGPVVPPATDLKSAANVAIAAVPDYADKSTSIKQLAFMLNFTVSMIPNDNTQFDPKGTAVIKSMFDAVLEAEAGKWVGFLTTIDPYLKACTTNAQFVAAVKTIQQALVDAAPDSGQGEMFGAYPTYGVQAEMDGKLGDGKFLAWLMKMTPVILTILRMYFPVIPNIPLPF